MTTHPTGREVVPPLDIARPGDDPIAVTESAAANVQQRLPFRSRCLLAMASSVLFLLAFAPLNQFYLAWIALVPWLIAVADSRSVKSAAAVGFIGGMAFFALNFWWLWHATIVGTFALLLYLSTWWGIAGAVLFCAMRWGGQRAVPRRMLLLSVFVPAAWTALEWIRGGLGGMFPWFALSQTQIPVLPICQIADITGHWGVTFWVVMCNALAFCVWQARGSLKQAAPVVAAFAIVTAVMVGYGFWRIGQTQPMPGPRVLVIQCNFPHARGGAKTVTWQEQAAYHFTATERALTDQRVDLVVWSETVMPAMNIEARRMAKDPELAHGVHDRLLELVRRHNVPIIFGAYALMKVGSTGQDADIRNAAYFYTADRPDQPRYDKVRLVPFGEYVWFRQSLPWVHRLLFSIAAYAVDYEISPGTSAGQTTFVLSPRGGDQWSQLKFVTPICMEDMDSRYVASLFNAPGGKRADLLVNITNDGWFNAWQKAQHLQAATFRSIENRVWTVRANNTGASGFLDSAGRRVQVLESGTDGFAVQQVGIDRRYSLYSRFGDWFAWVCCVITVAGLFITWRRQ